MEWLNSFVKAINYIEKNLLDDISADDIADEVSISSFYFQKAFQIFTGLTVTEYIRSRRLYQSAVEIRSSDVSITDTAYKYLYETPEAFTKAFTRFHGASPSKVRGYSGNIKVFLPLKIKIDILGGYGMDFVIEEMKNFKVVGFVKDIPFEKGYELCPKFWAEIRSKYIDNGKLEDGSEISQYIKDHCIGEFGVCIDDLKNGSFRYMIAGIYGGGEVPEGMVVQDFETSKWAKFKCVGPLPGSLQALNTKLWQEWVPNCTDFELFGNANIEWYSLGDMSASDYEAGIWLPIKEK